MDELQVIRSFRADVPASDVDAQRAARQALLSRIEALPRARRWPRLAVVVVALALAGVLAASGLALYDFIAGEPPPPDVTKLLVEEGAAERIMPMFAGKPNVIAEEAHGVAAIQTSAGRAILWVARTVDGDGPLCYFVEVEALTEQRGGPQGEANCGAHLSTGAPIIFVLHRATVDANELAIVVGWVHESVSSVFLHSPEGSEHELPLSERFFIVEVPAERVPKNFRDKAYSLVARDDGGRELERLSVNDFAGRFFFNPKVKGPRPVVIETADSRGRPMRLSLFRIEGGKTCVELKTRNGTSTSCAEQPRTDEAIAVRPTLAGSMVYLSGSVGPEVAMLELHHQDGYVIELPIVERFVLHDIPRARFEDGKRPILLVARGRDDAEVAREKVGQRAFAPNSAIWSGGDVSP